MRKLLVAGILLLSLDVLSQAQSIVDDCQGRADVERPSLKSPGWIKIRIALPLPFRDRASVYFDGIEVVGHNGKFTIFKTLGDRFINIDLTPRVDGETVEQVLDQYCPGISDRLDQALSQGGGRFATSVAATGQAAEYFTVADFDGDGNDDTAGTDGNLLTVSLLAADASVRSTARYKAGSNLAYVLNGDFNGDGLLDLVVSSEIPASTNSTSILLGAGGGLFQAAQTIVTGTSSTGVRPSAIAAADFNGDGKLDLAISSTSSVLILMGTGSGTFQAPVTYAAGGMSPGSMVVNDFDGDGNLDIVTLNFSSNTISMLRGIPGGTFKAAVVSPAAPATTLGYASGYIAYADLNHDGKLDLAVRYAGLDIVSLFLGNGDGSFQASRDYVAPDNSSALGIMPVPDGTFLFFTADRITKDTMIMIAPGDGTLGAPPATFVGGSLSGVAAGDITGDSLRDIVAVDRNSTRLVVMRNASGGDFAAPTFSTLPARGLGVTMGDLNGDGRLDVVTALTDGTVGVQLGTAGGASGSVRSFGALTMPSRPKLVDLNGDGKLDLVVVSENYYSSTDAGLAVLMGNGDGTFQSATKLSMAAANFAVGDFNNDQKPDLAVTVAPSTAGIFEPHNLAIFLGRGDGTFADPILTPVVSSNGIAAGDFNSDGKLDVAIGQPTGSSTMISVLLGNGNGTFGSALGVNAYDGGQDLQAADLDGDGFLDLLDTSCCGDSDSTYLLGNGDGSFRPEVHLTPGNDPFAGALADFNGDGKMDAAFVGQSGSIVALSLGFSDIVVTSAATPLYRIAPDSIASAFGPALIKGVAPSGAKVTVKDSAGTSRNATIFYASQRQINFAVPAGTALGSSQVMVTAPDGTSVTTSVRTEAVAPALFALNGSGLVAANVVRVAGGASRYEDIFQIDGSSVVARPIDLGPETDQVYLVLYGTGLRAAGTAGVGVTIGGIGVPVSYAGPQGEVEGFDQVNVQVPRSLSGKGVVQVILTAAGMAANTVNFTIK